jgi:GTP-binding protein EngB required for normal cell division
MLIDTEHGLKDSDLYLLKLLDAYNVNIQLVMTKCDKIPDDKLYDRMLYIGH